MVNAAMTDAQLQGLAAQGLNLMRRDIERGGFNFLLASYVEGGQLHRMKSVEALIIERLGEPWLNCGRTKDLGFGVLAYVASLKPPDAIVICAPINRFVPTPKFEALDADVQERMAREGGNDRHHARVKQGYFRIVDSLMAHAQTAQRICNYVEAVGAGTPPEVHFFDQDKFDGRLKMYGRTTQEVIRYYDLTPLDLPV